MEEVHDEARFAGSGPWRGSGRFGAFGPSGTGSGREAVGGIPPHFAYGHSRGGPPPWRGGRRARRGDIRLALLIGLLDGPAHGYELIGRLEARTGGVWRPSPGSVYPTLQLLEDEGLVKGREEDGKRVFDLTEDGRSAALEASEHIGGDWPGEGSAAHVDLRQAMKTLLLAMRQVTVAGDDAQLAAAVGVIVDARQRLYRILADGPPHDAPQEGTSVQTD